MKYHNIIPLIMLLALLAGPVACTNMSKTQQGGLSGAAVGAGVGAGIGALTGGNWAVGAAVGGALGGLAGGLYGNSQQPNKAK